ncbi:MAG: T9SS type A sorting domain-containing protein [Ignavibacteriaceae bacterium]|nr:T9SS type A sorting domain-containing protein [Ignavibacteriaceae bacterium]
MKSRITFQSLNLRLYRTLILSQIILLFASPSVKAQAANYSFSSSNSTYSEISDGTQSTATGDDGGENISLPFTFVYNGIAYNNARISTNGWLEMGISYTGTGWLNDLGSTFSKPLLCPLWDDLKRDASSSIMYKVSGTAPNRVFTVQWKNSGWSSVSYRVNFQVILFEGTNAVKFSYGAMQAPASGSASIGINDEVGGPGHFISVTPGAVPAISTVTANNSVNSVAFLNPGLEYTFTPPVQPIKVRADQITMNIPAGSIDQPVLRLTIAQVSPDPVATLSALKFNLSTTTNKNDIDKARVYYTGSSPVMNEPEEFGTVIISPDTAFTFSGSRQLTNGYHYFWLVYDLKPNATAGNFIDAGFKSADFAGLASSMPDTVEPPGNRKITVGRSGLLSIGIGNEFQSLTAALSELENKGVAGPVSLELTASYDTTNEQYPVYLRELPGVSSLNPVVIRPAQGINTVHLRTDSLAVLIFDGGKHFSITGGSSRNLLISNTNSQSHAVLIRNGSAYNAITKCEIRGRNSSTTGGVIKFTDLIMSGNLYNTISECVIRSADVLFNTSNTLIYATGYSSSPSKGNRITNNDLINFHDNGIYLTGGITGTVIKGNKIHFIDSPNFIAASGTVHGVRIDNAPNTLVEQNMIYNLWSNILSTYTVRGIFMIGSLGVPMTTVVRNNYISLAKYYPPADWGKFYGIDYYGYPENSIEIYYNTIEIGGVADGLVPSAGIYKRYSANNFIMKNNIIQVLRSSNTPSAKYYAVQFENILGNIVSDYNDMFVNGNGVMFGNWNGTDISSLPAWKTTTGLDANSISKFVHFADSLGPHLAAPSLGDLDLAGTTIPGIDVDIDGELRHFYTPYMGADESLQFPLPAELVSFYAMAGDEGVVLYFTTASELNVKCFQIERSTDRSSFSTIGEIKAAGTTTSVQKYIFTDNPAKTGSYFYRIRTVDYDGSFDYSTVIEVKTALPRRFELIRPYPNPSVPTGSNVIVSGFTLPEKRKAEAVLYDTRGAVVRTIASGEFDAGTHRMEINTSGLASGIYLIRITAGEFTATDKLVVVK